MKKLVSMLLAAVMLFSLAACGDKGSQDATTGDDSSKEFKAAMITDIGGINDQSYNTMAWAGMQLAEKELGIEVKYYESKTDADYEPNMVTAIEEGYDFIICVGYLMVDALTEIAGQYPDVKFAIIDSAVDLPNVTGIKFASEQCSYLVGVIAAEMTQTNSVGLVMGSTGESMDLFAYGYYAGVLDTNPDIQILAYNANSFGDVAGGKSATLNMYANGADIVYQVAGSTGLGVIEAAKEKGLYAIGVEVDQSYLAPEAVITSAMRLIDNAVLQACKSAMEGTLEGGIALYDIASGCVDRAPTVDLLTEEAVAAADLAKERIVSGEIKVPASYDEFVAAYGENLYTLNESLLNK